MQIVRHYLPHCLFVNGQLDILSAISRILSRRSSRTIFSISRILLVDFDTVGRRERSSSSTSVRPGVVSRAGLFGSGAGLKLTKVSGLILAREVLFVLGAQKYNQNKLARLLNFSNRT